MSTWYQSKVKYGQMVDGKVKTVSEHYLHDAVCFGEVETQCYERLKTRIKDMNVNAIAESTHGEVVFYSGTNHDRIAADPFYRIVIDTGGDKAVYLIPAEDAKEAIARALKAHGYGEIKNVTDVKRTDILAVWHPHSELWQGDWYNRMELLLHAKKHSWDLNQTEMDFGSNPTPPNYQPHSETGLVVRNQAFDYADEVQEEPANELPSGATRLLEQPNEEPAEVDA